MMMNCETIRDLLLTDYLDNELNPEDRAEVEAHLRDCPKCRKESAFIQRTLFVPSDQIKPVQPRRDLWPMIEKSIKSRQEAKEKPSRTNPENEAAEDSSPQTYSRFPHHLRWLLLVGFILTGWYFLHNVDSKKVIPASDDFEIDFHWISLEENNYESLLKEKPEAELVKVMALSKLQLEHLENYRAAHQQSEKSLRTRFKSLRKEWMVLLSDKNSSKEVFAEKLTERQEVYKTLFEKRRQGVLRIKEILSSEQRQALHQFYEMRSLTQPAKGN